MKSSKKRLKKQDEAKISDFFQVLEKKDHTEIDESTESAEVNSISNTKPFYVEKLKKLINENEKQSQEEEEENDDAAIGFEREIGENITESITAAAVIDMTIKQERCYGDTLNRTVCIGCEQKMIDIDELKLKLNEAGLKFKELQKKYFKMTAYCTEINLKYDLLVKTGTRTGQPDTEMESFENDTFSPNEIRALKGIPLDKKKDSSFVLQCLKFAYKSDLLVMDSKSVFGTLPVLVECEDGQSEEIAGKDPLTPEKVYRIRQLFVERLTECNVDFIEFGERTKESKLNTLMSNGIKNIRKTNKP